MNRLSDLRELPFQPGGKVIGAAADEHGRILVIDDGRQRVLNFDSLFEQSCMWLANPCQLVHLYTRFMALAVAFVAPRHVTLLGLGGGSLLRALHHALPQCSLHAIELRQAVVGIASEYFALPDDPRVQITVDDAFRQIAELGSRSSDIIFSDLYDAYRMAPQQGRESFLRECARVLSNDGVLVINLHRSSRDRFALFTALTALFPTVLLGTTAENCIVFAFQVHPEQLQTDTGRIQRLERRLQQRLLRLLARLQPLQREDQL